MSLFIAPHNDDEALFGSYIIQTYKPLVVVVTDSYIQFNRGEKQCSAAARIAESRAACEILGAPVEFLNIPDSSDDKDLRELLVGKLCDLYFNDGRIDVHPLVFAPAVEDGGNWQHNLIGSAADQVFGDKVKHYYTYTRTRDYPLGPVKVEATDEMKAKKLQALQCYESQLSNVCRMYFEVPQKDEYLDS